MKKYIIVIPFVFTGLLPLLFISCPDFMKFLGPYLYMGIGVGILWAILIYMYLLITEHMR